MKKQIDYLYSALKWREDDVDSLMYLSRLMRKIGFDENFVFTNCIGETDEYVWKELYMRHIIKHIIMLTIRRFKENPGDVYIETLAYINWLRKTCSVGYNPYRVLFNNAIDNIIDSSSEDWLGEFIDSMLNMYNTKNNLTCST